MDAQFNTNVYHFTGEVMTLLLEKFDGKVVGSDDMNMEQGHNFNTGDKVVPVENRTKETKRRRHK